MTTRPMKISQLSWYWLLEHFRLVPYIFSRMSELLMNASNVFSVIPNPLPTVLFPPVGHLILLLAVYNR
jgi:hypothetical protein